MEPKNLNPQAQLLEVRSLQPLEARRARYLATSQKQYQALPAEKKMMN
jgi:hypothetical protein